MCSVPQSCLTLWNPMDDSPLGFSVLGIVQARILEWVAVSFSRGLPNQELNLPLFASPSLAADCLPLCHLGSPRHGARCPKFRDVASSLCRGDRSQVCTTCSWHPVAGRTSRWGTHVSILIIPVDFLAQKLVLSLWWEDPSVQIGGAYLCWWGSGLLLEIFKGRCWRCPWWDEEVRRLKAEINIPLAAWGWTGAPSSKEENTFHFLQILF